MKLSWLYVFGLNHPTPTPFLFKISQRITYQIIAYDVG